MEDFVPFEIAKKLKEKGFNEPCYKYYQKGVLDSDDCWNRYNKGTANRCSAPTISQVLKWLREEKDIFIELEYINPKECGCNIIIQKTGGLIAKWNWDKFQYANKNPLVRNTYEQTALAGIEYVLNNLI